MEIQLCIPTLNQYDFVKKLIESAEKGSVVPDNYVVIDNGGSFPISDNPKVEVVNFGYNYGCAKSWNYFMNFHKGIKIICNDDIEFYEDTVEKLVDAYNNKKGDVIYPAGIEAGNVFSCFMLSSNCWKEIGDFDEEFYPAYFEDNDYHYRMSLKDLKSYGVPDCNYIHHGSATIKGFDNEQMSEHHDNFRKNQKYFVEKWGGMPGKEKFKVPFNK